MKRSTVHCINLETYEVINVQSIQLSVNYVDESLCVNIQLVVCANYDHCYVPMITYSLGLFIFICKHAVSISSMNNDCAQPLKFI